MLHSDLIVPSHNRALLIVLVVGLPWATTTNAGEDPMRNLSLNESVTCIAFGKGEHASTISVGCRSGRVLHWRDCRRTKDSTQYQTDGRIYAIAYTNDSSKLLVGNEAGYVSVLETSTGAIIARNRIHRNAVMAMSISADGRFVASCASRSGEVTISAIRETGLEIVSVKTFPTEASLTCDWFQADSRLAVGTDSGNIYVLSSPDWETQKLLNAVQIANNSAALGDVVFHRDEENQRPRVQAVRVSSDVIAAGCSDGTIRLWRHRGEEKPSIITAFRRSVCCVAFSGDMQFLAAGAIDGSLVVLNVESMSPHATSTMIGPVTSMAWSPGHRTFVTLLNDGDHSYISIPNVPDR